jgi:hypothetical protein
MNTMNLKSALACAAFSWLCWSGGGVCQAQSPAPGLSPDLQQVVRLSQAKMSDDIIKTFIANSGKAFPLSADDIIYLNSQGVSAGVISALQATALTSPEPPPAPAPVAPPQPAAPVAPAPAPMAAPAPVTMAAPAPATVIVGAPAAPVINFEYFHEQLAPFGTWVTIDGAMYWRPDSALAVNPDWRPYYDMGQWVQTENGLYWQSDYTWGDIPFHYGRWMMYPGMGWLWQPDYVWGPSWVFWRHDEVDGCIGWAPLPPGAVFIDGGFRYRGLAVGLDFDFGLGEGCFTFVGYDHFHERFVRMRGHEWAWHVDHGHMHGFFQHSVIRNDFHHDDHGRFVNNGIGHDRVEHLTHVERSGFDERSPVGDRNRLGEAGHREPVIGHGQPGTGVERPGAERGGNANSGSAGAGHGASTQSGPAGHGATTQGGAAASHGAAASSSGSQGGRVYRPPTGSSQGQQSPQQKDRH